MKKVLVIILIGLGIYTFQDSERVVPPSAVVAAEDIRRERAENGIVDSPNIGSRPGTVYGSQHSGRQIQNSGKVIRILSDDNDGSRHQRFIISLQSGQTLLVAHNIDLAPRIGALSINEDIEFSGEYEWNSQGGLVHWTHHDPEGTHQEGWLKYKGRIYK